MQDSDFETARGERGVHAIGYDHRPETRIAPSVWLKDNLSTITRLDMRFFRLKGTRDGPVK